MRGFVEDSDPPLCFLVGRLVVGHANVGAFATRSGVAFFVILLLVSEGASILAKVVIGYPAIGLGGLIGLVEQRESIVLGLVGDVNLDALSGEVLEGIVVVLAVD